MKQEERQACVVADSQAPQVYLRLFGLQSSNDSRVRTTSWPLSADLTVGQLWNELQRTAPPGSPLARLAKDKVLALVNGMPIQRLNEWETRLKPDDTVTFMAKAFGG